MDGDKIFDIQSLDRWTGEVIDLSMTKPFCETCVEDVLLVRQNVDGSTLAHLLVSAVKS